MSYRGLLSDVGEEGLLPHRPRLLLWSQLRNRNGRCTHRFFLLVRHPPRRPSSAVPECGLPCPGRTGQDALRQPPPPLKRRATEGATEAGGFPFPVSGFSLA